MGRLRRRAALLIIAVIALAFVVFRPGGYSETHPYLMHNCQRLADLCPSHYATWSPPYGGTDPAQHHIYGLCACSASVHAVVGT